MDPGESPVSRAGRTLWTFWSYITEAVNRFLRPEPNNTGRNDPNSFQESALDSDQAAGETSRGGIGEVQPLATASPLSSSQRLVAWECSTTERVEDESLRHRSQLSIGCEEQTGNDDAGLPIAEDARAKEDFALCNLSMHGQGEMAEDFECDERTMMAPLRVTDDTTNEDMEGSWSTQARAGTLDESQKMDEIMREVQLQGENDQIHHEEEQDLECKETNIKVCPPTDFSLEEECNMHVEVVMVQGNEAVTYEEEVEHGDRKLSMPEQGEIPENFEYEERANMVSLLLTDNATIEGTEGSGSTVGVATLDENQKTDEIMREIQVQQELEAKDTEITLCPMTDGCFEGERNVHVEGVRVHRDKMETGTHKEEGNSDDILQLAWDSESNLDEETKQVENEFSVGEEMSESDRDVKGGLSPTSLADEIQMTFKKSSSLPEDVGQEHGMARESNKVEDDGDESDGITPFERKQSGEENMSEAAEEEELKIVTEDSQDGEISTECVRRSEDMVRAADFTDEGKEDVAKDPETQTKARETDVVNSRVTPRHISVDERLFDKGQAEEKRLSGENVGCMETSCTATSFTVKLNSETGQEMSAAFKNIPPGAFEGWAPVSPELNSPTCEETQVGVPEYNNEPGPDENTTQRFLEVGHGEQIKATQLPEEVESKELESLQNSSSRGGCLEVEERMDEKPDSTEDLKTAHTEVLQLTVTGLSQDTEKSLGHSFQEEEGKLSDSSMKTGIEHSEKEFETHIGVTVEADDKTTTELQDGTDELLVEFEMDERLSGFKDAAGFGCETKGAIAVKDSLVGSLEETLKMLEVTRFFQEPADDVNVEQNSNEAHSLLEKLAEPTKCSVESESDSLEDRIAEMQAVGIDVKETGGGAAEVVAEDEIRNKFEMEILNVEGMAAELTTESNKTILFEDCETAKPMTETLECYEEMSSSVSESQDVIDEEILDLWIQTASIIGMEQQEVPEPEQQMNTKPEPSYEEQDEMQSVQTEEGKEQLVETHSEESGLASDSEMSPSTEEFMDQSVSKQHVEHSEAQLLKSTSTESLQDIYDMPSNVSESKGISDLSVQQLTSDLQDILMEVAVETTSDLTEAESIADTSDISFEEKHVNQDSDESLERGQSAGPETISQKEIGADVTDPAGRTNREDPEEPDVETLFKVEDETLEAAVSNSPDEIKLTESGQSTSGSKASVQEEIMVTESQDDTCSEAHMLLKPSQSEDTAESSPEPNRTELAEQLTTKSEDQTAVDTVTLDFAVQKSRIAVKNRHVRPPKDPRALLLMPSVDPTPSSRLPVQVPARVPLGGMGIGIKLPGLGAGFPVLKKTQRVVKEEPSSETHSQEPEAKPEEQSNMPKQDVTQHKPKWMPPKHPGFGNPLMSELKSKLKKTTQD